MGVPYIPVRGLAGTDVFERRPDMMLAPNPFDPNEVTVVALAQNPDVAILHGLKADREGNAILRRFGEDVMVAQASRRTISTSGCHSPTLTILPGARISFGSICFGLSISRRMAM